MPRVTEPANQRAAGQLRKYLAKYQDIELLLQLGDYKRGTDPDADIAIEQIGPLRKLLQQSADELVPFEQYAYALRRMFGSRATPYTHCCARVSTAPNTSGRWCCRSTARYRPAVTLA